jgi:hypothetical protein
MSTVNNEYTSSFTYPISNYDSKYLCLKIIPSYSISYLTSTISLNGGAYELTNGVAKNITDVKSGYSYYLFYQFLNIKLDQLN